MAKKTKKVTSKSDKSVTATHSTSPQPPVARRDLIVLTGLALVTLLLYAQTLGFSFVDLDDGKYVASNERVLAGLTPRGIVWSFTTFYFGNWHPLTWVSYMLDADFFGKNPAGFHVTNVLLHTANSLLVFWLLRRMTGAPWPSALVAALFAWHPLHVESVAWISERKDVLSAFFGLLAVWAYQRYAVAPDLRRYLVVGAAFTASLMAKSMLVTLPFVLLLLDVWPLRRTESPGKLILEKIPLLVLSAGVGAATFLAQQQGGGVATLERLPLAARAGNAATAYLAYLGKLFVPLKLAAFYPLAPQPGWYVGLAAALLVAVSAGAIASLRKAPFVTVGWFGFLGTLIPVIGLVQVGNQAYADRYTYLPALGIFIAAVWSGYRLTERDARLQGLAARGAAAIMVVLAALTFRQITTWENSITLHTQAIQVTRDNWLSHNNLGNALFAAQDYDGAERNYREAIRIRPDYAEATYNLGNVLVKKENHAGAIPLFQRALSLKPDYTSAANNLGNAYVRLNRLPEAVAAYTDTLRLSPDSVEAHFNLGTTLVDLGRYEEAIPHFSEALRLNPNLTVAGEALRDARAKAAGRPASGQ